MEVIGLELVERLKVAEVKSKERRPREKNSRDGRIHRRNEGGF